MSTTPEKAGTTWRYAITREQHDGENFYTIREVYTGPDGALSWTTDAIAARGDTWQECANDLSLMTRVLGAPILDLTLDPPAWVDVIEHRRALRLRPGSTDGGA